MRLATAISNYPLRLWRCSRGWRRVGTLSIAHCVWRCRAKARCCSRWRACGFHQSVGGQNSTWTPGLFGGGLSLLERRPLLAGGLLGLLIYKLQLGLLIPVALLAGRHWRASEGLAVSLGERDVAYWHETDLRGCRYLVANGGKADFMRTTHFGSD
jgi:hypothetical protein